MLQVVDPKALEEGAFVILPRYEVQASAGQGILNVGEEFRDFVAFDSRYLRSLGINPKEADVIQVKGRSMLPNFASGEWVIVDRSAIEIVTGDVYAVVYQGTLRVKRLVKERNAVVLVSDNKSENYVDERITGVDLDDLRVVGRVFQHLRSV